MKFSKLQIKQLLIDRFFLRFEPFWNNRNIGYKEIRPLECIQMDPLRIVEQNQNLVLHSRFGKYRPPMLNKIAYEQRFLIESYFNALTLVPVEEYRYHLVRHKRLGQEYGHNYEKFAPEIKLIKREIRRQGALPASSFECSDKVPWGFSGGLKKTTAALEFLWHAGDLMCSHRENGKRFYNLPKNVLPAEIIRRPATEKQYREFMLRKHLRTYILGDLRHFRFASMYMKAPERKQLIKPYLECDEIIPLQIEGVKNDYLINRENHALLLYGEPLKPDGRVRFLAPLDNLLFNRVMIKDIFDFDYTWEVYFPKSKRKYGYYVMPILYQFDFIGRIDPKANRDTSTLVFNLLQIEEKVKITDRLVSELAKACTRMADFAGMEKISIIKTSPPSLQERLLRIL